jgi:hypothetical protein
MAEGSIDDEKEAAHEISRLMKINPAPDFIKKNLSEKSKMGLAALVHERQTRQTLRVLDFLNKKNINYAVLKGISLSHLDRTRVYGDLDILVKQSDVRQVAELLIGEFGYRFSRLEELNQLKEEHLANAHDLSLISSHEIPVEIHYKLFNYLPTEHLPLLLNKVILKSGGVEIPCPAAEFQLLETVFHNAYHHLFICDRAKWARDINLIIRNYDIDWDDFFKLLYDLKQTELAYIIFSYLNRFEKSGVRIPDSLYRRLRPKSAFSYLKREVYAWVLYFIWDRLFPPKDQLYEKIKISPKSALFVFAYPLNWMRLVLGFLPGFKKIK